jgi:hypothetical protein
MVFLAKGYLPGNRVTNERGAALLGHVQPDFVLIAHARRAGRQETTVFLFWIDREHNAVGVHEGHLQDAREFADRHRRPA